MFLLVIFQVCSYLHGNLAVVDEDLLDQEIGADGGFITGTKLLVDL